MQYTRFIALGDSMTEGMTDELVDGKYRGWADRVADVLAKNNPGFTYMNLAIRGKLLKQVVEDQIPVALKYIEGRNTLVSFHAGANDVLRPNYKPEVSLPEYEKGIKQLTDAGATVIIFTVVDKVDGKGRTAALWHERFSSFNENVRMVAAKYPTILFEAKKAEFLNDRRFLAFDRLHMNPEGHRRLANAVLEGLGYEFDAKWRVPLPPAKKKNRWIKLITNLAWITIFLLPWIWRRIRGKSSGDGRNAKYSQPIDWPAR
ncbi:MAG: SGNH/GDSL hydrolase family protein [Actinobacteria bacterium]|nr:SGNH/GDSL hydrolase family protein [Actinomycetota bacterium]